MAHETGRVSPTAAAHLHSTAQRPPKVCSSSVVSALSTIGRQPHFAHPALAARLQTTSTTARLRGQPLLCRGPTPWVDSHTLHDLHHSDLAVLRREKATSLLGQKNPQLFFTDGDAQQDDLLVIFCGKYGVTAERGMCDTTGWSSMQDRKGTLEEVMALRVRSTHRRVRHSMPVNQFFIVRVMIMAVLECRGRQAALCLGRM